MSDTDRTSIPAAETRREDGTAFEQAVVECGRGAKGRASQTLGSSPILERLRTAGTTHIYADTADVEEAAQFRDPDGAFPREIDGSTANQPLVRKAVAAYLADTDLRRCAATLGARADRALPKGELTPLLYALVCARMGNDMTQAFGHGRRFEVSLQLHMDLVDDPDGARRIGRLLRRMVPTAFVKVPFTPHAPQCLLIARDLEREGIPVNLTSTFSARQVAIAALLTGAARTNVFLGRLTQGLEADLLGEHVALEAQRTLRTIRAQDGAATELIVASLRTWQTFVRLAGCDVFTAPCEAIAGFLAQDEVPAVAIRSQRETSYADRLGVSARAQERLGAERIARLFRVEPELLEFLRALRASAEWQRLRDADLLYQHFDQAGFGDVFHAPSETEWRALRERKLPDLGAPITTTVALDTLYSLLADGDFANHQAAIDAELESLTRRAIAESSGA